MLIVWRDVESAVRLVVGDEDPKNYEPVLFGNLRPGVSARLAVLIMTLTTL